MQQSPAQNKVIVKHQQSHPERRSSRHRSNMQPSSPNVVGVHYRVGKKLGEGSFGVIYEGTNLLNNQPVAIKFEPRKSEAPQLRDEFRSYKILAGTPGIPSAYHFSQEGLYNLLCIDLLGPSLEDLFDICRRRFSAKTVAMLAKRMLTLVESVHEHNLIYRDIKPDNFLIGRPHSKDASTVFMIDFGMAKQYRDPKTKQHIPYRERKSLSGTARYMSINTHLGREQSRRDDLEALGHVFMYFLNGSLPWQGLKANTNKQKYEKIGEKKQHTPIRDLCDGHPEQFEIYLTTVRKYAFEEQPDYNYLRSLFDRVIKQIGEEDDSVFDWMLLNNGHGLESSSTTMHSATRYRTHAANQLQNGSNLAIAPQNSNIPSRTHPKNASGSRLNTNNSNSTPLRESFPKNDNLNSPLHKSTGQGINGDVTSPAAAAAANHPVMVEHQNQPKRSFLARIFSCCTSSHAN
ncbi:Palmitoylated plasma membrane-bound casein kinase [Mycoemilia scoparia]|uniref:non-specific serine/threonine protein kinase n=1 Tax=Mycoemilia scoparia TaxID=417184 RepID=A0A9W8DQ49_9FUNG|nr:Palmitoylated plasma membrane-bound casein kinase [Mycoemilia scoparia]